LLPATDVPPRRGRPRSAAADAAILTAAVALVTEVGIGGLSMDDVAARAGVSKATIYRRWESKEALILDALNSGIGHLDATDSGTLAGDLSAYMLGLAEKLRHGTKTRDLIPHLVAAAAGNPALQPALDEYSRIRTRPLRAAFERAVARGEIPADTDVTIATELLLGAVTHRRLFSGDVFDGPDADTLVTYVLRALSARGSAGQ
jgi:AcrR family transcriptional regulator